MRQTYDKERVSFNLARLSKEGKVFEVVVDPDIAIKFRKEKPSDVSEALHSQDVFKDANRGELANENELKDYFKTDNKLEICKRILFEGEIQLSQDYREKLREEKKNRIIELIHQTAFDPRTNTVHPRQRIENAFSEAKIHVDEYKSAKEQISDIIKKLRPILPISFEQKTVELIIPADHAGKCYSQIKQNYDPDSEEWLADGSLRMTIKSPLGLVNNLLDLVNSMTHGSADIKVK